MSDSNVSSRQETFQAALDAMDKGVPARVALKPYYELGRRDELVFMVGWFLLLLPFVLLLVGGVVLLDWLVIPD